MTIWRGKNPLILASQSRARQTLLANAGIAFEAVPAEIDERAVQQGSGLSGASEIAALLAREKARMVSSKNPGRVVVGADQTLALGKTLFSKPAGRAQAAEQLRALAGNCHQLYSAVAVARDGKILFSDVAIARMTMRGLNKAEMDARWERITGNVITHIRRVLGVRKAVQEMCKYATKLTQLTAPDTVQVFEVIKGSRRIRSRGIYYNLPAPIVKKFTNCKECGAPIIQMVPADFDAWIASLKIDLVEDDALLDLIIGNKSGKPPPDKELSHVVTVDLTDFMWSEYEKKFGHQHHE